MKGVAGKAVRKNMKTKDEEKSHWQVGAFWTGVSGDKGVPTPVAMKGVPKSLKMGEIAERRCAKECVIA
jgi:hypothetical protein